MKAKTPRLWSREPAPIGTVRIHRSGKSRIRVVKVTHLGPQQNRWRPVALDWWLKNKGPVPEGLRVVHLNGDTLDDRPENYGLLDAAGVIALYRRLDPRRINPPSRLRAIREHNRMRGLLNRQHRWLPTRWYVVDLERRVVINEPRRQRWEAYRDAGLDVGPDSWRGSRGALLGWPGRDPLQACVLAALIDGGACGYPELIERVTALRELHGWGGRPTQQGMTLATYQLRLRGLIERTPRQQPLRATAAAVAARRAVRRVVIVRGSHIAASTFAEWPKTGADGAALMRSA